MATKTQKGPSAREEAMAQFSQGLTIEEEEAQASGQQPQYYQLRVAGPLETRMLQRINGVWQFIMELLANVVAHNGTQKDEKLRVEIPGIGDVEVDAGTINGEFQDLLKELYANAIFASFNTTYITTEGGVRVAHQLTDQQDGHPRLVGTRAALWLGDPSLRYHARENPTGLRSIRIVASGPQRRNDDGGLSAWLARDATNRMREEKGLPPVQPRAPQPRGGPREGPPTGTRGAGTQPVKAAEDAAAPVAFGGDSEDSK